MTDNDRFWPGREQVGDQFRFLSFADDLDELQAGCEMVHIITEGWQDGPVAAVLRGGLNAQAVLEVLSKAGVKDLTIFHLEEKVPHLEDIFLSSVVAPAHEMFDSVSINWRRDPSIRHLITSIGNDYTMLFLGAPLALTEIKPLHAKVKEVFSGSLTIVRGPLRDLDFDESDEIYKWIRARTFDANDFSVASVLRNYKKKQSLKIAAVLPSLNEAKTVGKVIKTALDVRDVGLIDEVILVDSGSTDNTVDIARSYDIPVYQHAEIEPGLGTYRGKGEAMFKSAFVTDADILAWVDTDIENITPRFFYGLLGPLLAYPDIKFAKGYFSRPVRVEASGIELGGGRVTEILARPWFNTFMPQLSGYIQPLAGTVAIYKDALLKMRIPANYGVEVAMLAQAVNNLGLWSSCQVNLGEVIHKSKDVLGLSEMSFQIMQVLAELMGIRNEGSHLFRRVISTHARFEMHTKRFPVAWREYNHDTL